MRDASVIKLRPSRSLISNLSLFIIHNKYWKFRCKVTPFVRSQTDPPVRFKMTPGLKREIPNRMQASAVFLPYSLHS